MNRTYTVYSESSDMTFIMNDTIIDGETTSTECIGWYYGKPNEKYTNEYKGKLKAEY